MDKCEAALESCFCDEMISKTKQGPSYSQSFGSMALSWKCPKHGNVTVDHRGITVNQAPDPIAAYTAARMSADHAESERNKRKHPNFRPRGY